jgi:serine/threonine protein phosphatase 1
MKQPIKTLEPNLVGRDFVISDIHGMMSLLLKLLEGVEFNPEVDRLISVGDLVDRGEDSLGCLGLLREPWFHAVLANHEQMMWEAFSGGYMGAYWIPNGGAWGVQALNDWKRKHSQPSADAPTIIPEDDSVELFDLLPLVEELPLLITVNRPDGTKFHIIHAEFPPNMEVTDEILSDPEKVLALNSVQSQDGDHMVWGRYIYYSFCRLQLNNHAKLVRTVVARRLDRMFNDELSHIISGHTILQQPMTVVGQTNIDTGGYGQHYDDPSDWEALTMVDLGSWKFYQATKDEFREVDAIVINKQHLQEIRDGQAAPGGGT